MEQEKFWSQSWKGTENTYVYLLILKKQGLWPKGKSKSLAPEISPSEKCSQDITSASRDLDMQTSRGNR